MFSGASPKTRKSNSPFDEEGVLIACQSIQAAGRGIGGYVMAEPALLVREDGRGF